MHFPKALLFTMFSCDFDCLGTSIFMRKNGVGRVMCTRIVFFQFPLSISGIKMMQGRFKVCSGVLSVSRWSSKDNLGRGKNDDTGYLQFHEVVYGCSGALLKEICANIHEKHVLTFLKKGKCGRLSGFVESAMLSTQKQEFATVASLALSWYEFHLDPNEQMVFVKL